MMQTRYCVLRDKTLFIYKDGESSVPLTLIFLPGSNINMYCSNIEDELYSFSISNDCKGHDRRQFYHRK